MDMIAQIAKEKIIPVVKLEKIDDALPLAEALVAGGINAMEITFRTAIAPECIALIKKEFPEMILGAGTVLTLDNLNAAIDAGSTFLVSPGFNPKTVEAAIEKKTPIVPGVTSPSLVEQAMNYGLETLKFFPANIAGGIPMLKTFFAVYQNVKFMPTGGLNNENFIDFLQCPNVLACGGSWMVSPKLIADGNFAEVTKLSQAARDKINANFA